MAMIAIDFVTEDLEAVRKYFRDELTGEFVKVDIAKHAEQNKYQAQFEFGVFPSMDETEPYAQERGYLGLFSDMQLKEIIGEFEIAKSIRV